ncbi:MAG: sulfate ABC transporter substrate-binding protein, partial [Solimonas sp.]
VKPGVSVVTPNPKTSGGARWNYLAAWEFAKRKFGGDAKAKDYVAKLYGNVPVLDTGARGATISFVQRNIGDVLLAWENDAFLALKEFGSDKFEIVAPSISVLAEPTVAIVDKNVDKKRTRAVAEEYLKYLYSDEGQDIAGKNFYRPISDQAKARYAKQFPKLALFTIDQAFGGWAKADREHFADGGSFDQIYTRK